MLRQTFPSPEALKRFPFGLADIVVILGTLGLLALIASLGRGTLVSFVPPHATPDVSLNPRHLPYYAGRSTLRMFIGLFFSGTFSLIYGYIAAHNRWAEKVLIPLLDILQSVPVLGFLSITVTGFIALFPGSFLGLEAASIFAIFTSQAWNMTFSFYQSLRLVPEDLGEAMTLYRLSGWERFTKLELPSAMIGLVWNGMMSFGGGWFFVAVSEAISVNNQNYILPGIGSYVAAAVKAKDTVALSWAFMTIVVVIVGVNQVFWQPVVAWADRFRIEQSAATTAPDSWLLSLLTAASIPRLLGKALSPLKEGINRLLSSLTTARSVYPTARTQSFQNPKYPEMIYNTVLLVVLGGLLWSGLHFILTTIGLREVSRTFGLGLLTLGRVLLLLILSTVIWTPIGVAIGFNPKLARLLQPVVQFLASFPANFIFPLATLFFIQAGISLNWGSILLMALGSQWYILFNSIAGAQSIPTDLREMSRDLGLSGWKLWQKLIIPGIFSGWVTGGITASGGAWNASIVSEVVSWGNTTLTASGLGAYIADATSRGDWPRITLGIGMMSLFVVGFNRILWRRLFEISETKYHI